MKNYTKLLMAVLTAALVLSLAAGTAAALRSLSVVGETTVTGSGVVTFTKTGGGVEVICPVTIIKTLARVIAKIENTPLGRIISITTNRPEANCRTNQFGATLTSIRILGIERTEKYVLFYESINGRLPEITAINKIIRNLLIGFAFESILGNPVCLYEEEAGRRGAKAREELNERQQLIAVTIGENLAVLLREAGTTERELCPREGALRGTIRTTGTPPTIRLV